MPGVALPPPPAAPLPRINGGRPRTNEYLFDGISVLQPEPGQVAFFPNVDAIQEFKIESNSPPAEFGRFNGGVVNLTTKSGEQRASRQRRSSSSATKSLNARNFFASANPVKPQFRRNQFGGVVGGPIRRDRTFFFVDYQGQRQTIGRTVISTVPTLLQRQGIFTEAIARPRAGHLRPGDDDRSRRRRDAEPVPRQHDSRWRGWIRVARALLERYPLPTSAGTANNYRRVDNETVDQDQFSLRIDHRFPANRDQVFGRLTRFHEDVPPGDAAARWQRRDDRHARAAGHHVLVVRVQLPAHVLEHAAQRAAHRRHAADRRTDRPRSSDGTRVGEPGPARAFRRPRGFRTRCRRF